MKKNILPITTMAYKDIFVIKMDINIQIEK